MTSCIFCQIAAGKIPSDQVYADQDFVAFRDLQPQAPVHVLIIPRRHIGALTEVTSGDADLLGRLQVTAAAVAAKLGLAATGYRFVVNCGRDGCQTVPHLHLHLLGGRPFGWPPG
ncbi:MAG: histidine triad nucleotide-binding protein [Candidatus Krumholzibacteria bacterium]|jgi:histidine triad (HIT) family protein|nr:histidine triad nucleotide-binding protein [Candidatus Krumholzibacteria bacterium]